ncbi:MAG: NAD(P)-binding domain-containing protein [Armatimonadetes bacterium]|nr:NAD(P)-binding domain-containing protein [Armatimonadota bacterium]MBS1712682.1 NAD(P)-binding domain-containing protein [Armatimonadota bacterium]MBX3110225.1 NAD(P)-binding domain-containing protein [Fimbriimonadaceae bacterium]
MKIGVIGRGNVGNTLGGRFAEAGYQVMYGVKSPVQGDEQSVEVVAQWADMIVLSVPATAITAEFFRGEGWQGKIVVDATNPIAPGFDGLDWGDEHSWGERVARLLPDSHVVKAFNTVGFNVMENPKFGGKSATMLVAGDDAESKRLVIEAAAAIGFSPEDAGPLTQARWLEAFAWLWISMAVKFGHGREMAFLFARR